MDGFQVQENMLVKYTGSSEAAVIPDGIRIIGTGAFQDNNKLKKVVIPDSVEEIRGRAFSGCTALNQISFSKNLRKLDHHVLAGCTSLETVALPGRLRTINYCTFKGCSALREVTISEGTKMISESAFSKCVSLRTIQLPKTMERVKRFAFGKCVNLRMVTFLSAGDCEIDTNSFFKCHRELTFSWPNASAFREELEAGFLLRKDGNMTSYFGNDEKILIPDSAGSIAEFALCGNRTVIEIDVPESVISIGRMCMSYMKKLHRVSLKGVQQIGRAAFWACTNLEAISVPTTLKTVGDESFGQCWSLRELDFGKTNTVFQGRIAPMAYGLKRVVLPGSIERLPNGAFYYCRNLSDIMLPYGIKELGKGSFEGCKSLRRMEIPETTEPFDWNVFKSCSGLLEIVLQGHHTVVTGRPDTFCTAVARYADDKTV